MLVTPPTRIMRRAARALDNSRTDADGDDADGDEVRYYIAMRARRACVQSS